MYYLLLLLLLEETEDFKWWQEQILLEKLFLQAFIKLHLFYFRKAVFVLRGNTTVTAEKVSHF